jgi:hypothetical protein
MEKVTRKFIFKGKTRIFCVANKQTLFAGLWDLKSPHFTFIIVERASIKIIVSKLLRTFVYFLGFPSIFSFFFNKWY